MSASTSASARDIIGTYDLVVVGGGVAGVAAAKAASAGGLSTAIIEPTGSLGREIVRARNLFVNLSNYSDSPTCISLQAYLEERKGWFEGQFDTNCAAAAFDDVMEQAGVDVWFQVWASRLLIHDGKIQGIEVATKSGYAIVQANQVIDASTHGKISQPLFKRSANADDSSVIHLLFNNVPGVCPQRFNVSVPEYGEIKVACRPTFWTGEWRVSLEVGRLLRRDEGSSLVNAALAALHEQAPELAAGVLTYIADDIWGPPGLVLTAGSKDDRMIAELLNPDNSGGGSIQLRRGVLANPEIVDGLVLSGPWVEGFPMKLDQEEQTIINLIKLGEAAGQMVLEASHKEAAGTV
jgi:hypothetical protein